MGKHISEQIDVNDATSSLSRLELMLAPIRGLKLIGCREVLSCTSPVLSGLIHLLPW